MKRLFAGLLVFCCLLTLLPAAWAEPVPEEEPALQEEIPEEPAEEEPVEEEPREEPVEEAAPEKVDPLAGKTAIRRMEITCVIDGKGEARITQVVNMNVVGAPETLRFAFPEGARNREIAGWRTRGERENGLRYLTVSSKSGFSSEQTFTLSFTLKGMVSAGEESLKLTLPLLTAQDYSTGTVALAVNLPEIFAAHPVFSSGYYGELIEDYMKVGIQGSAVVATVNDILQDSDSLTMELTLPENYFSGNFGKGSGADVLRVLAVVLAAAAMILWWKGLRNGPVRAQERTLPPDGVNPGDLPFLLSGGSGDFQLLVTHWATMGYLTFYTNKDGHVILRRNMVMGNERRPFERRLFEMLFDGTDVCDGASTRYQRVGQKAQMLIPQYWGKRLYDRGSASPFLAQTLACLACAFAVMVAIDAVAPEKLHGLFVLLSLVAGFALSRFAGGVFGSWYLSDWTRVAVSCCCGLLLLILAGLGDAPMLMTVTLAAALFVFHRTVHGGRRTPYGDEVIRQTLGFRKFLLRGDSQQAAQMLRLDPQYFYKILPYAQAMGQGHRFTAMFQSLTLEPCPWYESAKGTPTSVEKFYERYLDAMDMLNISLK